ncbi:DUF4328 domain-containing protein [Streptomyces abikoensis]|uniref:DUF4328 domain-containing protein n=1 Tax=Streptomyces abikoensis TaxID=97398 RepID=UPI00167A8BEF|nr:DUF4328 domain-containing protein [Streptomyces abikoensis]GGP60086.1 hypothetical protein GCM10010214_37070 [Streptomyces abikoensis]
MGPDGRCAACGAHQQPHPSAQPHPAQASYAYPPPYPYPPQPYPNPYPGALPGFPGGLPLGGVDLRRGVRIALNVLLGVVALLLMLQIAAIGQQRGVIQDILANGHPGSSTSGAVDDADSFADTMTVLSFLGMAATAVLWVIWFRRVRLNAEVFAPGTHRFGSGWAVGSWFTPVVNLWFPKQMANDIYRASAPGGPQSAPKGLLNAWWVLWIAANVLSTVGDGMSSVASTRLRRPLAGSDWESAVELLNSSLAVSGFSTLLLLADTALALLVVRQLTRMQEQRALAGPPAMPPVPPGVPAYGVPYGGAPYGPPPGQNPFSAGPAAS